MEVVELGGLVGGILGLQVGGLVGGILLLAGLDGEEQGLEAVTKDEAGTQGSACLTIHHIHYHIFTMYSVHPTLKCQIIESLILIDISLINGHVIMAS